MAEHDNGLAVVADKAVDDNLNVVPAVDGGDSVAAASTLSMNRGHDDGIVLVVDNLLVVRHLVYNKSGIIQCESARIPRKQCWRQVTEGMILDRD